MRITDGLRKYVQSWRETPNLMDDLDAGDIDGILGDIEHIADSIDAEYQKAIRELNNLADASVLLPVDPKCIQREGCNEFSPCGLYEAVRNDSLRQRVAVQPRLLDLQA